MGAAIWSTTAAEMAYQRKPSSVSSSHGLLRLTIVRSVDSHGATGNIGG